MSGWWFGESVGGPSCWARSDVLCTIPPACNWRCPRNSTNDNDFVRLELIESRESLRIRVKEPPLPAPPCPCPLVHSLPPGLKLSKNSRYSARARQKRYPIFNTGHPMYISLGNPTGREKDLSHYTEALPATLVSQRKTMHQQKQMISLLSSG